MKNIKDIRSEYDYFLKRYNELNNTFDFNDPIEIYQMYAYLLHNGYLSVNKSYNYDEINITDNDYIMGSNILAGKGVCRHTSRLLCDILNERNIKSQLLGVYLDPIKEKINKMDLSQFMVSIDKEVYLKFVKSRMKKRFSLHDSIERMTGNHVVTVSFFNEKSYFLDAQKQRMYKLEGKNTLISFEDNDIAYICRLLESSLNNTIIRLKDKEIFTKDVTAKESDILLAKKTLELVKNNIDIIEEFYNKNKKLYSDINEKIMKLHK